MELSFKVKFPCSNTPSPKGGGLRERNFTITQTLNFFWKGKNDFLQLKSSLLKKNIYQIIGRIGRGKDAVIRNAKQVKEMTMEFDFLKKLSVGQAIPIDKNTHKEDLLKVWQLESSKLKAKYPQILSFVSQFFFFFKPRLSVLKERRKSSDKPALNLFKASSKTLKGGKRYADKTTTRVLSRGFLHNPQPFENTQLFPHLLRDHPLSSYSMRWSRIGVVCVGVGLVAVVWRGLGSRRGEGKGEEKLVLSLRRYKASV